MRKMQSTLNNTDREREPKEAFATPMGSKDYPDTCIKFDNILQCSYSSQSRSFSTKARSTKSKWD